MKVLAPGAKVGAGLDPEATSEPQPVTQSEDGVAAVKEKGKEEVRQASSHAVLWPVVAQLGAPGLALVAVQGDEGEVGEGVEEWYLVNKAWDLGR
jgi:hypothetical protein